VSIHYALESVKDLERLRQFIADKNPTAASVIVNEIKQAIKKLGKFPLMGVEVANEINPKDIRDLFIGHYTVRYLVANNAIFILRLWHDKENERNK